jgi:hypothetical protein
MSRFASIKTERLRSEAPAASAPAVRETAATARPVTRAGKKAISGYFTRELSRALHLLALEQNTSLQALMGEAFDDLMRKYGKHPFGER